MTSAAGEKEKEKERKKEAHKMPFVFWSYLRCLFFYLFSFFYSFSFFSIHYSHFPCGRGGGFRLILYLYLWTDCGLPDASRRCLVQTVPTIIILLLA